MKKIIKFIFSASLIACILILTTALIVSSKLPDSFNVYEKTGSFEVSTLPIKAVSIDDTANMVQYSQNNDNNKFNVELKLFGVFPVGNANVNIIENESVYIVGQPFGIKIYAAGVMIVGMTDVDGATGLYNPAHNAGLKIGDSIFSINGTEVNSNQEVAAIIEQSNGEEMTFVINRNNNQFEIGFSAAYSSIEKKYKAGLWVRDSSAGIGTLTFFREKNLTLAGLGHGICDVDTGEIVPLLDGELVSAEIISIVKGSNGYPGELQGVFTGTKIADLKINCQTGVYGTTNLNFSLSPKLPIATKQEITEGEAKIFATINTEEPQYYSCVIEKVHFNDDSKVQNMIVKITDPTLIDTTGGIVQGMSGSPIIQNGKFIGAITHVFVNDSTKGYAIFAENMISTDTLISADTLKSAS